MPIKIFLQHCTACGGNWTDMLASGLRKVFPLVYATLPEQFGFIEVLDACKRAGVQFEEIKTVKDLYSTFGGVQ